MTSNLRRSVQGLFQIMWIAGAIVLILGCAGQADTPAFPGAEGFGKFTKGGRGGDVYCVTTLNDTGSGSLRHGIETASGPRTIVFEVAGTIRLKSPLIIEKKSHITVAGQTAPGKGITLRDQGVYIKHSQHIIVRYVRVRLGDQNKEPGDSPDVMTVDYNDHIILDHLSLSWGIDGNSDYRGNKNMTLQWLIYSEALNRSLHSKGEHAMATSLRDCLGHTTVHHNIYSTSRNRHPTLGSGVKKGGPNWIVDFRNCVNYNWNGPTNLGGLQINAINNYYRPGPCSDRAKPAFRMKDSDTTRARGFIQGNVFDGMPETFNQDNFTGVDYTNTGNYMSTTRQRWALNEAIDCGVFSVPTQSARDAYESCLKYAGCSLRRDTVDERSIKNIGAQAGRLIDSQNDVGGWDPYRMERRPSHWDTDRDGMPDTWETSHGLDPEAPADRNGDQNHNGYTNLEEYLNSLCHVPLPENSTRVAELDDYWAEVSRCVKEGDFEAYEATFHKDGILVSGVREQAYPISQALTRWKPDFTQTKSGKITASVDFRFSKRPGDETTAHETGMFLYSRVNADGTKAMSYIHFEALLIKKRGVWKAMMEYQKSQGSEEEWDKLK